MNYWLMKSEPEVYSIDHLARDKKTYWDGVRNYQARNFLRDQMKPGDLVFYYHSNAEPSGIAGIAEIASAGYPDPSAFDPKDVHYDPDSKKWSAAGLRPRHLKLLRRNPPKQKPCFALSRQARRASQGPSNAVTSGRGCVGGDKPAWYAVDIKFVKKFKKLISLQELKKIKGLQQMALFTMARLSVQPVAKAEWDIINSKFKV